MKKFILMFATLCFITFSANSQTKKGTVLLGAGSEFSDTEWTTWKITPKIGYFIQDGLAIGAEVHFDTDDQYFPAFAGTVTWDDLNNNGIAEPGEYVPTGDDHGDYTLTNNVRKFGVFARYYAARNLFMEVSLSSMTMQTEAWEEVVVLNPTTLLPQLEDVVTQERTSSSNVRVGMGYTLVWREHFAVEPYIHLDLIVDGEQVTAATNETRDLSGSEFVAGVNFSLFF